MSALLAFLHHLAAFTLVSAIAIEFVLIRHELTLKNARALLVTDAIAGASAGAVLVVGLLRVFFFEKGAAYYFHSVPFLAKLALFILVALISIYPTVEFLSWRKNLKEGRAPDVDERKRKTVRACLHAELGLIALLVLNAALMARGIGNAG